MSSDEYKSRMEDVFRVSQEDRKFHLLDPTARDWNDSYRSGLNDGVKAIMTAPFFSKPLWLKSDQQWAILKQLRREFWKIEFDEKDIEDNEKQVEETEHANDVAFILFLLEAEDFYRPKIERLIGAYRRLEQDWVAFMSQPHLVEVELRLILRLRLI